MARIILIFFFISVSSLWAQNTLEIVVLDVHDHQPLAGANVYFDSLQIGASTDSDGLAKITSIPNGRHWLVISYIGYQTQKAALSFPDQTTKPPLTVFLEPSPFHSEQIVVTSTRNNSIVDKTPLRIEVMGKEEVNEEIAIQPGNISKFLGESSSIVTRQTSAVSGAISFRLQGLPGRYTKLLKDGFPDFSGLASGFSPLQIPPLDLQQIEITRGALPTLFADGALAGIVNLISRRPTANPQWQLLFNQTDKQGTDISSFYSAKYGRAGFTFLVSQSQQSATDVDNDGFSDIPEFRQTTFNPRLFFNFDSSASLMVGLTSFFENRRGGDMRFLAHGADNRHSYGEQYATRRIGLNTRFQKQFRDSSSLTVKASYQNFKQDARFPTNYFSGTQNYGFTESSYFTTRGKHKIVGGASLISTIFNQNRKAYNDLYNSRSTTMGLFVQDDWNFAPRWTAHGGLRRDIRNGTPPFLLPDAALLFDAGNNLKLRLSGGRGYSVPALSEVAPQRDYYTYHVSPLFNKRPEASNDLSFDATYRYAEGDFAFSLNQAFYATWIDHALFANPETGNGAVTFADASLTASGAETHLVFNMDDLELFIDYNYADVRRRIQGKKEPFPFTPKHKLNFTATYEQEGNWRTGLEGFYTGEQFLNDGGKGRGYFIFGMMFEKTFKKFALILNVENILDERQSKYEKMVRPSAPYPQFKEIYMPIEGRVANLVLWIKL